MSDSPEDSEVDIFRQVEPLTPKLLLNGAREYCEAAQCLLLNPLIAAKPFWFCASQSIELSLKAILCAKGETKAGLKALGHELNELLDRCEKDGLRLAPEDSGLVRWLSPLHRGKVFMYREAGALDLPWANDALRAANAILAAATGAVGGRACPGSARGALHP